MVQMAAHEVKAVFAVITATEGEKESVVKELAGERYENVAARIGEQTIVSLANGARVVVAHLPGKGTLAAAATTKGIVQRYRPACVVVVGVCGGNSSRINVNVGDFFYGTSGVYYEQVKEILDLGDGKASKRAKSTNDSDRREFTTSEEWRTLRFPTRDLWAPAQHLLNKLDTLNGMRRTAFLCGERFLCSPSIRMLADACYELYSEVLLAVDMESAGVWRGCEGSRTKFLLIKGVSDVGNEDPMNKHHKKLSAKAIKTAVKWLQGLTDDDMEKMVEPQLEEIASDRFGEDPTAVLEELVQRCMDALPGLFRDTRVARRTGSSHSARTFYDSVIDRALRRCAATMPDAPSFYGDNDTLGLLNEKPMGKIILGDSIDGVQNLAAGRAEVAVSIASLFEGELKAGVVGLPYRDTVVTALEDGSVCANGVPVDLDDSPAELSSAVVGVPGDFERLNAQGEIAERTAQLIARLAPEVGGLRISGSLAYDLASVALGELDARVSTYATPADAAAGAYLIREAGGVVTDFNGTEWSVFSRSLTLIAARTRTIHEELQKQVKGFLKEQSLPSGNGLKTYCPLDEAD